MPKLFAFLVVLSLLLFGMNSLTNAEDIVTLNETTPSGEMTITYMANAGYTVTIPASVQIGDNGAGSGTLKISSNPITSDAQSVAVYLSKANSFNKVENNKFVLYVGVPEAASPHVAYTIKANDNLISTPNMDHSLLTQLAGAPEEASVELTFTLEKMPAAVGKYTDVLTFTVGLVNP